MKKYLCIIIAAVLIIAVFAGCSSKKSDSKQTINPKFTQGELNNKSIDAYYELSGELISQTAFSIAGKSKTIIVYLQGTADGGVVAWANGKYIYSPSIDDQEEVKSSMTQIITKELK